MSYMLDETEVMEKAKLFRYRKGALALIQREHLCDAVDNIYEEAGWLLEEIEVGKEPFLLALNDESELEEIRNSLIDLLGRLEGISNELRYSYVTEYFDDYLVGSLGSFTKVVGWDSYQTDYLELCGYKETLAQRESGKRLMRLTKEKLIAVGGQCFGILIAFLDLKHEYDSLTSVFGLIKDERKKLMDMMSAIDAAYDEWADENAYGKKKDAAEKRLDAAISYIPYKDNLWVI